MGEENSAIELMQGRRSYSSEEDGIQIPELTLVKMITDKDNKLVCIFCKSPELNEVSYGPLYDLNGLVCHYFCMLFSSGLTQSGTDAEGILGFMPEDIMKEVRRGGRLKCTFCGKTGASIGCCTKACRTTYHFPCGLANDIQYQFLRNFETYCPKHYDHQNICLPDNEELSCPLCMSGISKDEDVIKGGCCNGSIFHKDCAKQMALNAGYFLKCPLCNETTKFIEELRTHGVFVPEQDASWERGTTFNDLLFQYSLCDAKVCLCPKGNDFNAEFGSYELARCSLCGASAIHKKCGKLKSVEDWECNACVAITKKASTSESSSIPAISISGTQVHMLRSKGTNRKYFNMSKVKLLKVAKRFFPYNKDALANFRHQRVHELPDWRGHVLRVNLFNWFGKVNDMLSLQIGQDAAAPLAPPNNVGNGLVPTIPAMFRRSAASNPSQDPAGTIATSASTVKPVTVLQSSITKKSAASVVKKRKAPRKSTKWCRGVAKRNTNKNKQIKQRTLDSYGFSPVSDGSNNSPVQDGKRIDLNSTPVSSPAKRPKLTDIDDIQNESSLDQNNGGPISPLPCTSPTGTDAEGVDTGSTEAPRELEISDGVSAS
ncbi:uncharacterized protein LOC110857011 isoform X2 [Folsomia candida]|uniref:uncharacterized protein LOC110857011 isoform X2 n=1 Tax=Folsomia candida TaxID=158441 RepID=UPI000B8F839D|nr:uncharacterized protein LOC110857011 isoform X2 [Folsomia candida]